MNILFLYIKNLVKVKFIVFYFKFNKKIFQSKSSKSNSYSSKSLNNS